MRVVCVITIVAVVRLVRTSVTVTEMDSGEMSQEEVCVELVDEEDGLFRDVRLQLNTIDVTATGMYYFGRVITHAFNSKI